MDKVFFWPSAFCVVDDDIWFVYGKICILCRYSIKKNECKVVGLLPENNLMQESLFDNLIYVDGRLFIIPCWGNNIVVYNIKENKFEIEELPKEQGLKFNNAFLLNNEVLCIPSMYSQIVSMDIHRYKISMKYDMKKIMEKEKIEYFNDSVMIDDNTVIMISPQSPMLFCYKIKENIIEKKDPEIPAQGYSFIVNLKNKLVLCDDKGKKIFIYDLESKRVEKQYWPEKRNLLALMAVNENRVIIDDYDSSWMGIYDEKLSIKGQNSVDKIENRKYYYTYLVGKSTRKGENAIYFNNCDMSFNWIENDQIVKSIKIYIDDESRKKISGYMKKMNIVNESYFCRLTDFIIWFNKKKFKGDQL